MAEKQYKQVEKIDQREIEIMINGIMNYLYSFHSKKFKNYDEFVNFTERFIKRGLFSTKIEYLRATRQHYFIRDFEQKLSPNKDKEYEKDFADTNIDMPI